MADQDDGGPGRPTRWDGALLSGPAHGPLPVLLLALTVATGLVDAVSVLGLGRVFVANMTGNVVFLGFAIAGVPGFALSASLAAVAGFVVGAVIGGAFVRRIPHDRRRALILAVALESALVLGCLPLLVATAGRAGQQPGPVVAASVAALLAVAMGLQNGVVRHLAVPDLTTTVLTMTITGIAADRARSGRPVVVRRILAVTCMLAGAAIGAVLVQTTGLAWPLVPVLVLLLGVLGTLLAHDRRAVWAPPL